MTECSGCKLDWPKYGPPSIKFCELHAAAPETAAELKHLRKVNSQMLKALLMLAEMHSDIGGYDPEYEFVRAAIQAAQDYGGLNR